MVSEAGRVNPVSVQAASPSCAFQLGLLCGCTPAPRLKPLRRHSWGQGATWWHATSQGRDGMLWSGQEAADSQRPLVSAACWAAGSRLACHQGLLGWPQISSWVNLTLGRFSAKTLPLPHNLRDQLAVGSASGRSELWPQPCWQPSPLNFDLSWAVLLQSDSACCPSETDCVGPAAAPPLGPGLDDVRQAGPIPARRVSFTVPGGLH